MIQKVILNLQSLISLNIKYKIWIYKIDITNSY